MTKDEALRLALEVLADLGMKHYENTGEVLYKNTYTAIKSALEAKDEPVALKMDVIVVNLVREGINKHRARELAEHFIKHTTTPPQRKPLTDEEIWKSDSIMEANSGYGASFETLREIVRAIEAAHGIKENT